jgi:hypothetical protein
MKKTRSKKSRDTVPLICGDGLGFSVQDCLQMGHWIESSLEQFLLKTKAVNSGLRNRNMVGKILTWWKILS